MYFIWRHIVRFTDNTNLAITSKKYHNWCISWMTPIFTCKLNFSMKNIMYRAYGLKLGHNLDITDEGIKDLPLTRLDLRCNHMITNKGIKNLSLTYLDLTSSSII